MANRVLRDGLVDSEPISTLSDRAFRLYIHLQLAADDYGLVQIDFGPIRKAAPLLDWNRDVIAKMLGELTDAELILPYQVAGKCYAAIARWKARINCRSPKHPIPSFGMQHMLEPYGYKSVDVKNCALKICLHFKGDTLKSAPPVNHQLSTGVALVTEGVRSKGSTTLAQSFARFWFVYPKKKSKGNAEKAWQKINPNDHVVETILAAIERAKLTIDWRKEGGQYIPYPATWLNARGWEDETVVMSELRRQVVV